MTAAEIIEKGVRDELWNQADDSQFAKSAAALALYRHGRTMGQEIADGRDKIARRSRRTWPAAAKIRKRK